MYIPGTDDEGLCSLLYLTMLEAVDGIDIANGVAVRAHPANQIDVALHGDNSVTVADNGCGLPVAHRTGEIYEPLPEAQRILTTGFTGSYNGAAIVNALSQQFHLTIWRDGHIWEQSYSKGEPISELHQTGETQKHGTSFHFLADSEIFSVNRYDIDRLIPVMNKFVYEYKDMTLTLTDERDTDPAIGSCRFLQFKLSLTSRK